MPSCFEPSETPEVALQRLVYFFENLQPAHVLQMTDIYCADAQFKDPFNEVTGVSAIAQIFTHMFEALDAPHFVITKTVQQGTQCFVAWDFLFSMPNLKHGAPQTIRGVTHFELREESGKWRIAIHRDYWDVAEELYEKLPVIGSLMRWLKKRANA